METLTNIPFDLDGPALMAQASVPPDSSDAREFAKLLDAARAAGRPKAAYRECFIDARDDDTVTIDGVTFTSRALCMNLQDIQRVFPFVATCGAELDAVDRPKGDVLADFWWDTIKASLLGVAAGHLNEHLAGRYRLGRTIAMSPGSGDTSVWPIEQQKQLFALLGDVHAHIGVTLTDSCLMVPNKTISGIRFPTERDFRACQVCHRENCPSRSAPFDADLWAAIQHD